MLSLSLPGPDQLFVYVQMWRVLLRVQKEDVNACVRLLVVDGNRHLHECLV